MDFHQFAIAGELLVATACNGYQMNHWTILRQGYIIISMINFDSGYQIQIHYPDSGIGT